MNKKRSCPENGEKGKDDGDKMKYGKRKNKR
jgi:hypothetical protein